MVRIRVTQRRKMIDQARAGATNRISAALAPLFKQQKRKVVQFLRRSNLRKRMNKIEVVVTYTSATSNADMLTSMSLNKANKIMLDMGAEGWQQWRNALSVALKAALILEVINFANIENAVWTSRDLPPAVYNPQSIISSIEARTGIGFGESADSIASGIEKEISEWYASNEPFPALMARIDKYFDDPRIRTIAETRVGDLISQVTLQAMLTYGWLEWYWDAQGENPCSVPLVVSGIQYNGCLELHGKKFKVGSPMPPGAAHPKCLCIPTPVV